MYRCRKLVSCYKLISIGSSLHTRPCFNKLVINWLPLLCVFKFKVTLRSAWWVVFSKLISIAPRSLSLYFFHWLLIIHKPTAYLLFEFVAWPKVVMDFFFNCLQNQIVIGFHTHKTGLYFYFYFFFSNIQKIIIAC